MTAARACCIAPLFEQVWADNAALLAGKGVEMWLQVEDDLPQVEADLVRVEQIEVRSQPGEGSTFSVYLPISRKDS